MPNTSDIPTHAPIYLPYAIIPPVICPTFLSMLRIKSWVDNGIAVASLPSICFAVVLPALSPQPGDPAFLGSCEGAGAGGGGIGHGALVESDAAPDKRAAINHVLTWTDPREVLAQGSYKP